MDDDEVVGAVACGAFTEPIGPGENIVASDLMPEIRDLIDMGRKAKATISSIYATCEGAGGWYKEALDDIMRKASDFLWPRRSVMVELHDGSVVSDVREVDEPTEAEAARVAGVAGHPVAVVNYSSAVVCCSEPIRSISWRYA